MDTKCGTLGRRGMKGANTAGMRRQRSLEWRQERNYSSSEEDIPKRPVDSHVFASLLAQAQQEYSNLDRQYRSDDTEDAVTTDNPTSPFPTPPPTLTSPRSPVPMHRQASPFPLESINSRRLHYAVPQTDRMRKSNGEVIYATSKKNMTNNTLGRNSRNRHRIGGMKSSGSATSCDSCTDNRLVPSNGSQNEISYHESQQEMCLNNDVNEDSPPEPAPPEVPPRGPSLHSTSIHRRPDYTLPVADGGVPNNQDPQFLSSQGGE